MKRHIAMHFVLASLCLCTTPGRLLATGPEQAHPLMGVLSDELKLAMEKLVDEDGNKPYFIQYGATDTQYVYLVSSLGANAYEVENQSRELDVDVRVGSYELDNTRQIRDRHYSDDYWGTGTSSLPLDDNPLTTRHAIWLHTDRAFRDAVERLANVKANLKIKVETEDVSDDFSKEEPNVYIDPWVNLPDIDRSMWKDRLNKFSRPFRDQPLIYNSYVTFSGGVKNELMVSSEGSQIQVGRSWYRIDINAVTIAEDGMQTVPVKIVRLANTGRPARRRGSASSG